MTRQDQTASLSVDGDTAARGLYARLLGGWNARDAAAMGSPFADDGEIIGFDGSHFTGRIAITEHLRQVFADHIPPRYVSIVRAVRQIGPDVLLLRAVAGMVPDGQSSIQPSLNTHQTVIATRHDGAWRIVLFQNTPAQFHGRPDLADALTAELQQHV